MIANQIQINLHHANATFANQSTFSIFLQIHIAHCKWQLHFLNKTKEFKACGLNLWIITIVPTFKSCKKHHKISPLKHIGN
jgi:hypothetical protein